MMEIGVPAPIITRVMKIRAIMRTTISPVMIRQAEIEHIAVRIVDIHPETPFATIHIDRTIEIFSS